MLERIARGRTDLVFDLLNNGLSAKATDEQGIALIQWCAYFGDVSAVRYLLTQGETLETLGPNFDLNGAAFHGHWQLTQFLLENGADANFPLKGTAETPLHAALCTSLRLRHDRVLRVLIAHGADPNVCTQPAAETGGFMRDSRTKAESPLHRAAAFGTESTIKLLLDAGAKRDAQDMHGDSPLSWASWYLRPDSILRLLCYGDFSIRRDRDPQGIAAYVLGEP